MMKHIHNYIKEVIGKSNKPNIVQICKQYYINKVIKEQKIKLNPKIMLTVLNLLSKHIHIPGRDKLIAQTKLKNIIFNIKIQSSQKTKMAPIFHPKVLLNLITQLWYYRKNKNTKILLAKRQAALQAMLCLVTGRRWVDITRIKWDTMQYVHTPTDTFIKFLIPVSKTNQTGTRIETINLRQNKTDKQLCPVNMIQKLKTWVGQPTNGFVFKCLAPNTKWVDDELNPDWSSYRCKGHWNSDEKTECLGQTSTTHSFGYIHRFAQKKKWKTLPTKHTFRRTCLIIAKQLKISREQINEGFGWVPQSDMIRHYTADHDSTTLNAPAVAIAHEFDKKHPFTCVNNVNFNII